MFFPFPFREITSSLLSITAMFLMRFISRLPYCSFYLSSLPLCPLFSLRQLITLVPFLFKSLITVLLFPFGPSATMTFCTRSNKDDYHHIALSSAQTNQGHPCYRSNESHVQLRSSNFYLVKLLGISVLQRAYFMSIFVSQSSFLITMMCFTSCLISFSEETLSLVPSEPLSFIYIWSSPQHMRSADNKQKELSSPDWSKQIKTSLQCKFHYLFSTGCCSSTGFPTQKRDDGKATEIPMAHSSTTLDSRRLIEMISEPDDIL